MFALVAALLLVDPCAGRPHCRIAAERPAGTDAEGHSLAVLRVALDPRDTRAEPPAPDLSACIPYEWWLRRGDDARKILWLCDDGYVVATDGVLYVEVRDDVWKHGAERWIFDDHVEIWAGPGASYQDKCVGPDQKKPVQWGIGLFGPWVRPAFGDPKALPGVERAVAADLVATSDLRPGEGATLGRIYPAKDGRCVVAHGRLDYESTWAAPKAGPLLPGAGEPQGVP